MSSGVRIDLMSEPMQKKQIVIYSDDSSVRASIVSSLGRRVASDLAEHTIHEFATGPALRAFVDSGAPVDLFILDGESAPEGGLGIANLIILTIALLASSRNAQGHHLN